MAGAKKKAAKKPAPKKAPAKPAKAAAKKPAAAAAPQTARVPSRAVPQTTVFASGDTARALLSRLPPLDGATRTVFARQLTLPELARLGGETVAVNVLRESGAWLVALENTRRDYPEIARRYGAARLAYFAERVLALEAQLVKEGSTDEAIAASRRSNGDAVAAARGERDHLAAVLTSIVRGDPTSSGVVAGVKTGKHDDGLADALFKLAAVASQWLERAKTDLSARTLVDTFGLGEDDVAKAHSAREALIGTSAKKQAAGRGASNDSPELNVLEGIVLVEMKVALAVLQNAHDRDPGVPLIQPGPGVHRVLVSRPKSAAAKLPSAGNGAPQPTAAS